MAPAAGTDYPYRINPKMRWICSMPLRRAPPLELVSGNPASPPPRDFAFTLVCTRTTDCRGLGADIPWPEPQPGSLSTSTEPVPLFRQCASLRRLFARPPERTPQRRLRSPGNFHPSDGSHLVEQGRRRHYQFSSSKPERTRRCCHIHPGQSAVSARMPWGCNSHGYSQIAFWLTVRLLSEPASTLGTRRPGRASCP